MSRRRIAVFGATGRQGGSVVTALLSDTESQWIVRGVTRDVESAKAREIQGRGAELARCDLSQVHTKEGQDELRNAVKDCYGVYLMTDYWTPGIGGREREIGEKTAEICKEMNVKHIIWSTLPSPDKMTNGELEVPHFSDKTFVDEKIEALQFDYRSYLLIGFYFQNFATFSKPLIEKQTNGDGVEEEVVVFRAGHLEAEDKLAVFDVDDTGNVVLSAFRDPERWGKGAYLSMTSELLKMKELVETFQEVTGKKAVLRPLDVSGFERKIKDMWEFKKRNSEHPWGEGRDWKTGIEAYPKMRTWREWLQLTGFDGQNILDVQSK